MASKMGC